MMSRTNRSLILIASLFLLACTALAQKPELVVQTGHSSALKTPAADVEPRDDQLLLREWLDYPTSRVPQMQHETIEQGARGLAREVIFVEGEETVKDPSKRSVQRPRVFYRREVESNPVVVAKP